MVANIESLVSAFGQRHEKRLKIKPNIPSSVVDSVEHVPVLAFAEEQEPEVYVPQPVREVQQYVPPVETHIQEDMVEAFSRNVRDQVVQIVQEMLPSLIEALEETLTESVSRKVMPTLLGSATLAPKAATHTPVNYQMEILRDKNGKIASVKCLAVLSTKKD